jgi:SH3 domain-containing YSC84-like protein 1
MKKLLGLILMAGMAVSARAADISNTNADMRKLNNRMDNAANTLEAIQGIKERGVPKWIASKADCIAVVPGLFKGAFIIGAEYGQGVVSCRTKSGWSGPVFIRMAGGSFGFQAGGSGTDLVLVATNERGMQDLMQTKLKLGGTAAGAAGPLGRTAQASTNLTLRSELLTYSRSHGLFAGVDLSGVTVMNNEDDTVALYGGQYHNFQHILDGQVAAPDNASARHFLRVLNQYFGTATQWKEEQRAEKDNKEH